MSKNLRRHIKKTTSTKKAVDLVLRYYEGVLACPEKYDSGVMDLYCTARVLKTYASRNLKLIAGHIYDPFDPMVQLYIEEKRHFERLLEELCI